MVRRSFVVVLSMLIAWPLLTAADPPRTTSRLFIAERTTEGAASLALGGGVDSFNSGAYYAIVAARTDARGRIVETGGAFVQGSDGDTVPGAYVLGDRRDCRTTTSPICGRFVSGSSGTFSYFVDDEGSGVGATRVYVAIRGLLPEVYLEDGTRGWTLREVEPEFHTVRAQRADAAGVKARLVGAEVFLAATAAGGRHGSIAIGQPPCDPVAVGSVGIGLVELRGGAYGSRHVCPTDVFAASDVARDSTEWQLEGLATGTDVLSGTVRLVVIDLPAPPDRGVVTTTGTKGGGTATPASTGATPSGTVSPSPSSVAGGDAGAGGSVGAPESAALPETGGGAAAAALLVVSSLVVSRRRTSQG